MGRTVWYPGHMARGGRQLAAIAEKLDLIIEVRDSRAPFSTSSPMLAQMSRIRPVMLVLSKADLADPDRTKVWLDALGPNARALDLHKRGGLSPLLRALAAKRPAHRELRLAVMGIPNVGKSMLLNALIGKSQATVGGIPGVTRSVSWYRKDGLLVVDSPGILDPHAEKGVHQILSWLGCAKAEVTGGFEAAAIPFIQFLKARGLFGAVLGKWEIEERDELPEETLERIGRRLGCLAAGGNVNTELAGRRLMDAFSSGKLGRVTLEMPGDAPLWGGE